MGYRLENKDVDLSGIKPLKYVPTKKAGDVYRYKNNVLRIFRENESHIEEETAISQQKEFYYQKNYYFIITLSKDTQ